MFKLLLFFKGAIRMVVEGEVNFTLGYFTSSQPRDDFMTASAPYFTSNLIWAIPPGRAITSLEKLLKPFTFQVWVCFLIVLGFAFATIAMLQLRVRNVQEFVFGRRNTSPYLNVFNVVLGGPLHRLPTRNFARTVLGMFMIYCFVVQNSYKGGLFKFMQLTVREPECASTEELIAKNTKFYMLQSSRGFFTQMPKQILESSVIVTPKELGNLFDELSDPGFKGALLTSNDHLAYRNIQASPHRYFHHAEEHIMTHNIVVYMPKQSSLAVEIDNIVIHLLNGGLIQTWASKFTDKNFLKNKHSSNAAALNMKQLAGAFQLLFAGLFICFVALIAETFFNHRIAESE
jgi:hypothetical protein